MAQDASALLSALSDMFPALPDDILLAALEAHNNHVENTIAALLEMCEGATEAVTPVKFPATSVRNAVTNSERSTSRFSEAHPSASDPADRPCSLDRIKADGFNRTQLHHVPVTPPTRAKAAKPRSPSASTTTPSTRKTWAQLRGEQLKPPQGSYLHQGSYRGPVQLQLQPQFQSQPQAVNPSSSTFTNPALLPPSDRWPRSPQYVIPGTLPTARLVAADFPNLMGPAAKQTLTAAANRAVSGDVKPVDVLLSSDRCPAGDLGPASACTWNGSATSTARSTTGTAVKCPSPKVTTEQSTAAQWLMTPGGGGCGMLAGGYAQAARRPPPGERGGDGRKAHDTGGTDDTISEAWQRAALDELCRSHTWAGQEVVEAVCLALQYDLEEVVATLDELAAASYQCQQIGGSGSETTAAESSYGSSSHGSESASGAAFVLEEDGKAGNPLHLNVASSDIQKTIQVESTDESEEDEKDKMVLKRRGNYRASTAPGRERSAAAFADGDDFAVAAGTGVASWDSAANRSRGEMGCGLGGGSGLEAKRGTREGGKDGSGRSVRGDGDGDVYGRHRHAALKLTHAWRKKMNKASAAFAEGDRALGRQLVVEAQQLRQQATVAHREAAAAIETEMNDGRQLGEWELDLHGLHADEAVQALARRIATLELGTTSPSAKNLAHHGNTASSATGTNQTTSIPTRRFGALQQGRRARVAANVKSHDACLQREPDRHRAPPASTAAASAAMGVRAAVVAGRQDLSSQVLAARRVLRVVVGKGLHSSGGEASLPRVVQAYLTEQGYRFAPRAGVVEVQLRRRYAVQSGAVLAVQHAK